ncbi:MAG: hypothetical protein WB460_13270 [Candidatus Acidiferrales bacterium]
MPSAEKLDTHRRALTPNLDTYKFGSFAEIGAGQEVARWFLFVGGASGTMAEVDLREAVRTFSPIELERTETNAYVSAEQLRFKPPLDHLYAYLLASNFLVPLRIPAKGRVVASA